MLQELRSSGAKVQYIPELKIITRGAKVQYTPELKINSRGAKAQYTQKQKVNALFGAERQSTK